MAEPAPEQSPRRPPSGVRIRILGWYVVLLAGAIAVGLILQREALLQRLDAQTTESLEQEAQELSTLAREGVNPETGVPFGDDVKAILDTFLSRNLPNDGEVFIALVEGQPPRSTLSPEPLVEDVALVDRWRQLTMSEAGELSTPSGPVRYLAVPLATDGVTTGTFVVANFVGDRQARIESSVLITAAVLLVSLLLATAAAWFVAGRLLRPIQEVTDTARTITEGAFGKRIPIRGNDEVAELARSFNAMVDRLALSFETQRTFISDAGHELRTPITIIGGHLEMLGDDPEERAETMAIVTDELDRMTRMVDDLLLLARSETPDFLRPEPLDLETFVGDVFTKASALGDRDWVLHAEATGVIVADGQRLTQAVLNLVRNAVGHTERGGVITLGSESGGGKVRIWVQDTGTGISPDDHERIFERFARGRDRRRSPDGAGLGLAIVLAIIDAHGGEIELSSALGVGSRFTLVLPGH
ncbi:MAG: HAMP domain-containing histidine kinase [Geodermatophilaceae bacterium]|nr:HAMP domain-containing histidine kinase [Geodermatophilaceae bacterium]MBA3606846.1 HAMP domain-containing histidine kinase [Acidimicrobiia bacterium]